MKETTYLNYKSLAFFVMLFLTTTAFSFQPTDTFSRPMIKVVTSRVEASAALYLSNLQYQTFNVSIQNQEGEQMHKEEVSNDIGFAKMYNLTDLAEGNYAFRIECADRVLLRPFAIRKKRIVLNADDYVQQLKPIVNVHARMVEVSADLNQYENNLAVTVMDARNNVVYEDKLQRPERTTKRYNLMGLQNGTYTLKIMIEDNLFYETIVLR
ncbi:MAG: hypothetical protein AB8G22_26295 [Saprospiraceae bacterium]